MPALNIILFLVFQIIANLLFKWGSTAPRLYWWGFGLGNAVGVTSIIFMLGMYRSMPSASVVAIGTGGVFILNQITLQLVYREKLGGWGVAGILLIFAGILMVSAVSKKDG